MSFQQTSNTAEAIIQSLHPFFTYIIAIAAETVDVGPFTEGIVVRLFEDGMFYCNSLSPLMSRDSSSLSSLMLMSQQVN